MYFEERKNYNVDNDKDMKTKSNHGIKVLLPVC